MRIHLWCPVHSLSRLNYAVRLSTDRGTNALMQHTVSSSTQWPPSSTTNDVVFAHDSDDVALGQRALTRGILRQPSSARPESDKLFQALKLGQDKTQEHVASLELKVDGLSKQLQLQQRSHDHLLDKLSALQQLMMRSLSTTACAGPPAQGEFA